MRKLLIMLVGLTFACATAQKAPDAGPSKTAQTAPGAAPSKTVAAPPQTAPAAAPGKTVANPRQEDFPVVIGKSGIKVDGDLSDWPAGLPVGRVANASGSHAANFRVFVDAAQVYWAFEVADSTPTVNKQGPGNNWDGDAVELLLGTHDDDRMGLQPGDVQIIVGYNPAAPLAWNYFAGKAADGQVAVKDVPGGWLVEASFSLAALGLSAPAPGAPVWVDMALDNADGGGRAAQLIWIGSTEFYHTPMLWKKTTFTAQP